MNTRELRIGNYVSVGGKIVKVNGITQHKIGYCPEPGYERYARSREVEPIKISSEDMKLIEMDEDNKFDFIYDSGVDSNLVCFSTAIFKIDYLHQLQNMYFMCYGEELQVKAWQNQNK